METRQHAHTIYIHWKLSVLWRLVAVAHVRSESIQRLRTPRYDCVQHFKQLIKQVSWCCRLCRPHRLQRIQYIHTHTIASFRYDSVVLPNCALEFWLTVSLYWWERCVYFCFILCNGHGSSSLQHTHTHVNTMRSWLR